MCSIFFLGSLVLKSWGFSRARCSLASVKLQLLAFLLLMEAPGLQLRSCFRQVSVGAGFERARPSSASASLCPALCQHRSLSSRGGELPGDLSQLKTSGLKCCFAKVAQPGSARGWRSTGAGADGKEQQGGGLCPPSAAAGASVTLKWQQHN